MLSLQLDLHKSSSPSIMVGMLTSAGLFSVSKYPDSSPRTGANRLKYRNAVALPFLERE